MTVNKYDNKRNYLFIKKLVTWQQAISSTHKENNKFIKYNNKIIYCEYNKPDQELHCW